MQATHEGESLTRMIARKDVLTLRLSLMREVVNYVIVTDRLGRNEIKYVRTIDVAQLRKEMDGYAKRLRELDLKLQSLNWTLDLV